MEGETLLEADLETLMRWVVHMGTKWSLKCGKNGRGLWRFEFENPKDANWVLKHGRRSLRGSPYPLRMKSGSGMQKQPLYKRGGVG